MPTDFIADLTAICGHAHVLTRPGQMRRFTTGFRFGSGKAVAAVRPGSLVEMWRVLQACTAAGKIVILQAANTGLTGGSTPDGEYDREVVVVSTLRLTGIQLLDEGRQAVCLPGATLYALEQELRPLGREPHSVIGSSCLGASVLGGIGNNSGGALVQRGPAFTQLALYAQVDADGVLRLVNHLGIELGSEPEEMLERLQAGRYGPEDVRHDPDRQASDRGYAHHVRQVDAPTPARFNADPARLFEASGSAGKVAIFAARLDTFEKPAETAVFYIGTNDPAELTQIRRDMLGGFATLPVAGEYMHRTAFDIAATYGKDTFLAVKSLGTDRLPALYALKGKVDALAQRLGLPAVLSDRLLQGLSRLFPQHLPPRMLLWRQRYRHHLMLRMGGADSIAEARAYLRAMFPTAQGDAFECTAEEGSAAFLHRFAAAGAAVRYRAVHGGEIVALDVALRRDDRDWFETLPVALEGRIAHSLYYGHFFCHVFHQDYILKAGEDALAVEHEMWALLDARGAAYPAEHNVGHLYRAAPALEAHYRALDPTNSLNPGIGHCSRHAHWT